MGFIMFDFLDKISFSSLLIISIVMLLLPFRPQPHVVEKLIMLRNGELKAAIDIFDLIYHLTPSILLIIKVLK